MCAGLGTLTARLGFDVAAAPGGVLPPAVDPHADSMRAAIAPAAAQVNERFIPTVWRMREPFPLTP